MLKRMAEWSLVFVLAALFFAVGVSKFLAPGWTARFVAWGYPAWMAAVIGAVEIVGALLLVVPRGRTTAALLLMLVMVGAGITHLTHGELPRVLVNAVLASLLVLVLVVGRRPDRLRP